ncbi:MAG: biopolymer transporter ExbD [Alistipes sp.]|jgi:biopolymer transport protein ExbD|nr:biopolymer transporter ExbD [Alistipes sp.]
MEDKRQVKEINASSMADIAFLLLIFFLVATTMNVDTGITRQLPPMLETEEIPDDLKVKERNLLPIFVNSFDNIMVAGQPVHISQVTEAVKRFVLNVTADENLPEKKDTEIAMPDGTTWVYPVSEGVVSLNSDRGTSYDVYIQVQNELTRAFNELREDVAQNKFHKSFTNLSKEEQEAVADAVPQKISEAEPRNTGRN